LAKLS
jgi:hypothetical protein